MKPSSVKKALIKQIINIAAHPQKYCKNPETDFSRHRMLSFQETIEIILGFSGKSITNELLDRFEGKCHYRICFFPGKVTLLYFHKHLYFYHVQIYCYSDCRDGIVVFDIV